MPNWTGVILTDKGRNLQAKLGMGVQLNFTKIKFGDGIISSGQSIEKLLDLVSPKQNVGISSVELKAMGVYEITAVVSNEDLAQGYLLREMGLFATDPDIGEILFAISIDPTPDYLQAYGGSTIVTEAIGINIVASNTSDITAIIDPKGQVTVRIMNLAIKTHNDDSNAHAVAIEKHNDDKVAHAEAVGEHNENADAHAAAINKHNDDYNSHAISMNFWQKARAYKLGDIIYPKVHGTPYFLICTQAGTSSATEPAWTYTEGTVINDNGVKWKVAVMSADGGGMNLLKRSTAYQIGDIAYSKYLPSWARLECVKAGTTANVEPQWTNILGGG